MQHPGSHYIKEIEKWGDYGKDLEDEMIHSTFNKTEGRLSMGGNAPISNCFFMNEVRVPGFIFIKESIQDDTFMCHLDTEVITIALL